MSTRPNIDTNSPFNNIPKKKKVSKKYKILAGIGLGVAIIIGVILYNWDYVMLSYGNAKYNDFKTGDKLYAKNRIVNEPSQYGSRSLNLYRKIRPLNADDVDAMEISLAEKALIKNNLNPSDKPGVVECAWAINSDSLCKYKTACIGNYTGSEILNMKLDHKYYPMLFFSITTNRKALIKEEESASTKLPSGYVYDDGPFYVTIVEVTHQELHQFRKLHK